MTSMAVVSTLASIDVPLQGIALERLPQSMIAARGRKGHPHFLKCSKTTNHTVNNENPLRVRQENRPPLQSQNNQRSEDEHIATRENLIPTLAAKISRQTTV